MKDWLDSVKKMTFLNGVVDLHFSEDVMQTLAYAYHEKFKPIEAVSFFLLVANKMGDDDPAKVREIEARAMDLMLLAKPDEGYNAGPVREHVSRFVEMAAALEPSRSAGYSARLSDPLGMG